MVTVERIRAVLLDQEAETAEQFASQKIISREGLAVGRKTLAHPNILLVTGARRSGKSVFAHQVWAGEPHVRVNFDDERLAGLEASDLNKVLEAAHGLHPRTDRLVLDEIQNVPGWERFAGRIQRTMKVVITGSNATLLSREMGTFLVGRYLGFTIHPFSFREVLRFHGHGAEETTRGIAATKGRLKEYLETGGFPEAITHGQRFLLRLYEDVIQRDVLGRFGIRFSRSFKELARLLMANSATEFTYSKLGRLTGIGSVHTVKNYVDHLESSFLLVKLERMSTRLKEQVLAPKKAYAIDPGVASAFSVSPGPVGGRLIETVVLIELLRRQAREPGLEIGYWKDHRQREVDFVLRQKGRFTQLVQVAWSMEDFDRRDRELGNLAAASETLRCKDLLLITWEEEGTETVGGRSIRLVPLWRWLLHESGPHQTSQRA